MVARPNTDSKQAGLAALVRTPQQQHPSNSYLGREGVCSRVGKQRGGAKYEQHAPQPLMHTPFAMRKTRKKSELRRAGACAVVECPAFRMLARLLSMLRHKRNEGQGFKRTASTETNARKFTESAKNCHESTGITPVTAACIIFLFIRSPTSISPFPLRRGAK
jgi:hypothetical protein